MCDTRYTLNEKARNQQGLTLTELMVSLALTATLTAGLVEVLVGMRQTETTQAAISRMQESERFALGFLSNDLHMSGYVGCLSGIAAEDIQNTLDGPPPAFQPDREIQGWEADGTAPGDINNRVDNVAVVSTGGGGWSASGANVLETTSVVPGTDILRVWFMDEEDGDINSITPGASTVVNTEALDIQDEDILLLSDCEQAAWVQACNVQSVGSPVTLNLTLSSGCNPGNVANLSVGVSDDGKVAKLNGIMYYIGKRDDAATNPPSLYRRRLTGSATLGAPEELVEGVADMQILYGENINNDNDRTADAYVTADQVTDWSNVVSVRISILVQSLEDYLVGDPQPYVFNAVSYDGEAGNGALPDDGRLRRAFTATVGLRNRVL
ncbi:MAG: PilW family protein [Pseudohongiellaceae bacterium]